MSSETFGAHYLTLPSAPERLDFERSEGRRERFEAVDAQLDDLVLRALRGERVVAVARAENRNHPDYVELRFSAEASRAALEEHFSVERQQARGAWYIPESGSLAIGLVHLAHWWRTDRRFTITMAERERATPSFQSTDAVAVWAALQPLFEELFLPLKLRSDRLAPKTREQQLQYWAKTVDPLYDALGVGAEAVREYRPQTGWAELDAERVMARRDALFGSWAQADAEAARRLRTYRIGRLVERYYSKAKNGRALRRRVMTKELEPVLAAYFGGDWLALLAYLREEPDPSDEVTTALPKPRLMVGSTKRAASVAAAHGLASEEMERMLAAFWNRSDGSSPVEERVRVLERLWHEFHSLHARQASGTHALWGLMNGPRNHVRRSIGYFGEYDDYNPGMEEELLSAELLTDLRRLWGTKPFKSPERLVSEPAYTWAAVRALGPAFDFWQELGDSIWFICEGPQSRTDLPGLEQYVRDRRPLGQLEAMGYPVDGELFVELRAAESMLGPPQETWRAERQVGDWTMRLGGGTRRDGFEILRDIVTRHRRTWAQRHLNAYLENRWKGELTAVSDAYHRFVADKTKPPTVKQFLKMATPACTNWFAGALTAVYAALGLKAPIDAPTYSRLLPDDARAFMMRVFLALGGKEGKRETFALDRDAAHEQQEEYRRNSSFAHLADESLRWVELAEGLGRQPELDDFGPRTVEHYRDDLGFDVNAAWETYTSAVQHALTPADAPAVAEATNAERVADAVKALSIGSAPASVENDRASQDAVHREVEAPVRETVVPRRRSLLDRLRGK